MNIIKIFAVGIVSCMSLSLISCGSRDKNRDEYDDYEYPTGQYDEVKVQGDTTYFTLWAPTANAVRVNLYESGDTGKHFCRVDLIKGNNGLWHGVVPQQLYGKYYTFNVRIKDKWLSETPGIWTKAAGVNGNRAAIIDLDITDPEGWEDDQGPQIASINDAVIYEVHHRDFSVHPSSGIENKGKFLALTEKGTHNPHGAATGIDHLKELGVTHVHILPSYDFNSVNEADTTPQYNWGYDPWNYNVPEGSYSTNPYDPAVRIKEMKQMVKALHDEGIGVIMDVVYNHTALNDDSNFSLTVPGYFYRHNDDGTYSDASGCGNETASERKAVSDYIVNSVKYWAREYHIDGFRFDLMGIHDIETMNRLSAELKEINPDIILYGEGWTAGPSPLSPEDRALKDNVSRLENIAVFSDDLRDAVKGHYSDAQDRGFATGKPGNEETVKIGIVAATAHPQVDYDKGNNSKAPYASSPAQVINYVSCHDDLSLTDKLAISMPHSDVDQRQRAAKLAQTIVFTSQGVPFIFAGEEIFRNKQGIHNTYKSPDSVNAIDWNLKIQNADLFNYYKELIELRKNHPAFRMTSAQDIANNIVFELTDDNFIAYSIKNNANGDEWQEIKVILNGGDEERSFTVEEDDWTIVAHDGLINHKGLAQTRGGLFTVPQRSATILGRK